MSDPKQQLELFFYQRQLSYEVYPRNLSPLVLPDNYNGSELGNAFLAPYGHGQISHENLLRLIITFGMEPDKYSVEIVDGKTLSFTHKKRPENCTVIRVHSKTRAAKISDQPKIFEMRFTANWEIITMQVFRIPSGFLQHDGSSLKIPYYDWPSISDLNSECIHAMFTSFLHGGSSCPAYIRYRLTLHYDGFADATNFFRIQDLLTLLDTAPGCTKVEYYPGDPNDSQLDNAIKITLNGTDEQGKPIQETKALLSIAICFPYAKDIILSEALTFNECDASFYATAHYSYAILNSGKDNHTYPLAIIVYPTESQEMYLKLFHYVLETVFPFEYTPSPELNEQVINNYPPAVSQAYSTLESLIPKSMKLTQKLIDSFPEINIEKIQKDRTKTSNFMRYIKKVHAHCSIIDVPAAVLVDYFKENSIPQRLLQSIQTIYKYARYCQILVDYVMLPIVSDMGLGLKAAFKYNKNHVYCHVHILRAYGTNADTLIYLLNLLSASKTKDRFEREAPFIKAEIISFFESQSAGSDPPDPKLLELIAMCDGEDTDAMKFVQWAISNRTKLKIPRCSNHSESLHCHINRILRESFRYSQKGDKRLFHGLIAILHVIGAHMANLQKPYQFRRSAKDKFETISKKRRLQSSRNLTNECQCGTADYYTSLYGINLGCHCMKPRVKDWKEIADEHPDPIPFCLNMEHFHTEYVPSDYIPTFSKKSRNATTNSGLWAVLQRSRKWGNTSNKKVRTFLDAIKHIAQNYKIQPDYLLPHALECLVEFQSEDDTPEQLFEFRNQLRNHLSTCAEAMKQPIGRQPVTTVLPPTVDLQVKNTDTSDLEDETRYY